MHRPAPSPGSGHSNSAGTIQDGTRPADTNTTLAIECAPAFPDTQGVGRLVRHSAIMAQYRQTQGGPTSDFVNISARSVGSLSQLTTAWRSVLRKPPGEGSACRRQAPPKLGGQFNICHYIYMISTKRTVRSDPEDLLYLCYGAISRWGFCPLRPRSTAWRGSCQLRAGLITSRQGERPGSVQATAAGRPGRRSGHDRTRDRQPARACG